MNNEKLENLLNLALNATPEEREKSLELNVGYDTASRSWEVIVKTSGGFDLLPELFPQITIHPLLNGYGILTVPANLLDTLSERPEIEYMEKMLGKEMSFLPEVKKDDYLIGHTGNYLQIKCKTTQELKHEDIMVKLDKIEYPYIIGQLTNK